MLKFAKTSLLAVAVMATSVVASDILVTVNGKNITKQDAEQFVAAAQPNAHFAQLDKAQKEMIKQRLVEKVLFTELAKKEGIENDAEFKAAIEKIKEELLVNIWMKKQLDNTLVSDSEAKEFYEKNKAKFKQPETVKASHILVKTEDEAKAIIAELKPLKGAALKEKFVVLAKSKSTGPSGPKGGDLGTFSKEQMVPEFSKAVWALKDGTVTLEAVKTQFGYHVIYLEKKNSALALPYDAVKDKIIISLKQKQFAVKIAEVAKELKSKAKIVDTAAESNSTKK
jgi:parvulin-like peptidyl-prolyl isomerase